MTKKFSVSDLPQKWVATQFWSQANLNSQSLSVSMSGSVTWTEIPASQGLNFILNKITDGFLSKDC